MADEEKKKSRSSTTAKAKLKTRSRAKSKPKDGEEAQDKRSVAEIVTERLIAKITNEQRLPWQQPFKGSCMNWYTEREYAGINRIILSGSEYITYRQLQEYNKKNETDYSIKSGTPYEIAVYWGKRERILTKDAVEKYRKEGKLDTFKKTEKGYVYEHWFLMYHRVWDITLVQPNSKGEKLPSKMGVSVFEQHTPAQLIVDDYTGATGVKIEHGHNGAWYRESGDLIGTPSPEGYLDSEAYYRVLFHEMIHSTGIEKRLNRACFKKYHSGKKERSREELIAEVGAVLLASEAGFRSMDTWETGNGWDENSMEYLHGWCSWMKDNPDEVVKGIGNAEKAKNFILDRVNTGYSQLNSEDEDVKEDAMELALV